MKKITGILSFLILLFLMSSCGYIARAIVTPDVCKKCEILNEGVSVWSEDACGGGVHNMEQRAKAKAYELGPGHEVVCIRYKSEE